MILLIINSINKLVSLLIKFNYQFIFISLFSWNIKYYLFIFKNWFFYI